MRNLIRVIDAIIDEIPTWRSHNYALCVNWLEDRKETIMPISPEGTTIKWKEVADILDTYIGNPDAEWKDKIWDIFDGRIKV